MTTPTTELIVDFAPVAPDAPADAPIAFSVRNEATGDGWNGGSFRSPLDAVALADLRWYLEEYVQWPFGPWRDRAHVIEARLEQHGRALFAAIFDDREPARIYERFLDTEAATRTLTLISTAPHVLRLPWELLAESSGPLFTKRPPISIRRRVRLEHAPRVDGFSLPLRILLVVARPDGAGFVDPRSVARGVLDALDELGGAAQVDFLRPPTLASLDTALRRAADAGRPYHIVHFDGHGVYSPRTGLGQLAFERADHSTDLVDANRLGALLNECGIPLAVLNACQSAQGDQANPFSSVATRLLEAGVGAVLSMSHSVLVVSAARFMRAFYAALVTGATVGRATEEARRELVRDTSRFTQAPNPTAPEEAITLHDWFLPVLYQQRADAAPFVGMSGVIRQASGVTGQASGVTGQASGVTGQASGVIRQAEGGIPAALTDPTAPGGLPAEPLHGFHGRAGELLRLERLFRDHAVVVLHGYGGQGKTALASEAARWLHRTGRFPGGAAFIPFERGGGAELALAWARQALLGEDFADAGQVAAALHARPGLVIFDNFESVLAHGDTPLAADEMKALLDLAWQWAGGNARTLAPDGPRVLITTRDVDFGDARFAPSRGCAHVQLAGLGRNEALELARAVLRDRGIDHAQIDRGGLARLMELLGGHPLSLYLVLPRLAEKTPDELVAAFDALLPGFTAGAAKERNESLAVSLEFSLRRLGAATRAALPDLGVFAGLAMEDDLLTVTGYAPALWATARSELVGAGLATLEELPGAQFPYIRFHPTLLPYLRTQLAADHRRALDARYWQRYYALSRYLYREDTKNPHFVRALAVRDLPNLRRGLDLALARAAAHPGDAAALEAAVGFAERLNKFLTHFGLRRERVRVQERVDALLMNRGDLTRADWLAITNRGEALRSAGRAQEAEVIFRNLLARVPAAGSDDAWGYERAATILRIGRTLATQGRPEQAADAFRQTLAVLAQGETVRRQAGVAHTDLANVLTNLGCYGEALAEYEASLEIARKLDDHRQVAVNLGQLGILAP
jgi:tetratricopeptide (TPR) repeat protein